MRLLLPLLSFILELGTMAAMLAIAVLSVIVTAAIRLLPPLTMGLIRLIRTKRPAPTQRAAERPAGPRPERPW